MIKNLMWQEQERGALQDCDGCDLPCKPHYRFNSEVVDCYDKFCSIECAQEWIRENSQVQFVALKKEINCEQCGKLISPLDWAYIFIETPYEFLHSKKFCSPDCAHDYSDELTNANLETISRNVLPINALEFMHLTSFRDPRLFEKLGLFEGRGERWYVNSPWKLLTAPSKPHGADSQWSSTIEYLQLFTSFCIALQYGEK